MTKQQHDGLLNPKTCPICGKTFIPAPEHVYKTGPKGRMVCSWGCVCRAREKREVNP